MNDTSKLVEAFGQVAIASIADAVDKVCGHRGYMDHPIKPQINDQRICGPAATVLEAAVELDRYLEAPETPPLASGLVLRPFEAQMLLTRRLDRSTQAWRRR